MTTEHLDAETIAALLDRRLSGPARDQAVALLDRCDECYEHFLASYRAKYGWSVLLADNRPSWLDRMAIWLEGTEFKHVVTVCTSNEALTQLKTNHFDVVVMNELEGNGTALLEEIVDRNRRDKSRTLVSLFLEGRRLRPKVLATSTKIPPDLRWMPYLPLGAELTRSEFLQKLLQLTDSLK